MTIGTLYGIGVGPGDPELISVKGAAILARCLNIFVPKSTMTVESAALSIANRYVGPGARIHELLFPMTADECEQSVSWKDNARAVIKVLASGEDACFITVGDILFYSTFIYLLREVREILPNVRVVSIPGITAFSAAAAALSFPIGEGREPVTIISVSAEDTGAVREALTKKSTVILMKIGRHLPDIIDIIEAAGLLEDSVFISRAGLEGERVETDLKKLRFLNPKAAHLSIILVHAGMVRKEQTTTATAG
ncbi:MAG: Cobalt-precorrin-2 C(20)-methyltransferase [Syntrophus sp. SKADARSKE-3]|nr:Cobalt-precorrin-2 C(20)-methyltransferase [Syntrophus sp. SKADARSKE-3]